MRFLVATLSLALLATIGCKGPMTHNLPPAPMLAGPGPGVDGPGPGVIAPMYAAGGGMYAPTTQFAFAGPEGMQVQWDVTAVGAFDSSPLVCPGKSNFRQMGVYRLKLTSIPGRAGVELYPTLEVAGAMPRSAAFLAHNAVPVQFTEEDLDQVLSGNFVTKVIYLPDPEFQELALAGVDTLVSTRLDPGVDPIVEADRRGAILAVVRLGNKDLQVPGDEPQGPAGMMAGGAGPGFAPPYLAGMTAPPYGMPSSGTPIGLVGPPHVPLGAPAGLYKHQIVNHTAVNLPQPTHTMRVDVKQKPGYSYPKPVDHVRITEHNRPGMPGGYGEAAPTTAPCPCPLHSGQATEQPTEAGGK